MKAALILVAAATVLIGTTAQAGTENVKFPKNYATDYVQYTFVNKTSKRFGPSFRKFYINRAALAAFTASGKLPSGTVIVREDWIVKKDADKKAIKGADGNFIAINKKGVVVSEKRDGWGTEYPASKRNGNWEYAAFKVNGERNPKAKIGRCFGCHLRKKGDDFIFTMKQLRTAAKK